MPTMPLEPTPSRPGLGLARVLSIAFVGWTGSAALISLVIVQNTPPGPGGSLPWLSVFRWAMPEACLWTVLTPLILAFTRWTRWDRTPRPVFVAAHVSGLVVSHLAAAWLEWALRPILRASAAGAPFHTVILDALVFDAIRYLMLVAGAHAAAFRSLYERERHEALALRAGLLEAELAMLRLQLQPHFLFNALHAISELVYRDPRLADRAIARLADLLRGSLASDAHQESSLDAELELLQAYLDIERLRAGESLATALEIEPETRALAVPVLLLQPLVENALRHGIRGRASGSVLVAARRDGAMLELRVEDDGVGISDLGKEGLGLRATRARLRGIHGAGQELCLEPRPGGGTVARVRLPARVAVPRPEAPGVVMARAAG